MHLFYRTKINHVVQYRPQMGGGGVEMNEHNYPQSMQVINRLSRATGHLESVKKMAEEGRDCSELLVQISAVVSALNNASKVILEDHTNHCIVEAAKVDDKKVINDLIAYGMSIFLYIKAQRELGARQRQSLQVN